MPFEKPEIRQTIIAEFAAWTALSALRSGSPVKGRKEIYSIIEKIAFSEILEGAMPITQPEFDTWHQRQVEAIATAVSLNVGWIVKIVNVYLKTAVYIGDLGRPGLRECIHPPIDGILWDTIKKNYSDQNDMLELTHSTYRIKNIMTYAQYQKIIDGLRLLADRLDCTLFEVEQLWVKK